MGWIFIKVRSSDSKLRVRNRRYGPQFQAEAVSCSSRDGRCWARAWQKKGKLRTIIQKLTQLVREDFTWKDPKAAEKADMPLIEYADKISREPVAIAAAKIPAVVRPLRCSLQTTCKGLTVLFGSLPRLVVWA
jgi:hypothetical protein